MATRATPSGVKEIIDTNLSDSTVQSYIDSANALLNVKLSDVESTLLGEIEKWFSAHLIATTRERQLKVGEAGSAKAEYFGKDGTGLSSSTYGQQAIALDPTGRLKRLSEGRTSSALEAM